VNAHDRLMKRRTYSWRTPTDDDMADLCELAYEDGLNSEDDDDLEYIWCEYESMYQIDLGTNHTLTNKLAKAYRKGKRAKVTN
jgi:hypothetical protein